jgi:hypothetical protein
VSEYHFLHAHLQHLGPTGEPHFQTHQLIPGLAHQINACQLYAVGLLEIREARNRSLI